MAKVTPRRADYRVEIHEKFIPDGFFQGDPRFFAQRKRHGSYWVFNLRPDELKPFFQVKYLDAIGRNIVRVNYGGEIAFEHLLVTDNLDRGDFTILDRQVTDSALRRRRIDLLGATKVDGRNYKFVVIEVKLGSNPELGGKVPEQLAGYMEHIEAHFSEWVDSY